MEQGEGDSVVDEAEAGDRAPVPLAMQAILVAQFLAVVAAAWASSSSTSLLQLPRSPIVKLMAAHETVLSYPLLVLRQIR